MDVENLMSVKETAERLSVTTKTIYRWFESGKVPYVKIGTQYFVEKPIVESLVTNRQGIHHDALIKRVEELETKVETLMYRVGNVERRQDAMEEREIPATVPQPSPEPLVPLSPLALPQYGKPVIITHEEPAGASITWTGDMPEGTTARVEISRPQSGTLPEGHVNYTHFYREHGISSGVADRARGKFFPVVTGPWHDERGHPITYALDTLGQWNFCNYFKARGKLVECDNPSCACHQV